MSSLDAVTTPGADGAQSEQDLGPLAWVLDELRKSLDSAVKAMRRFVRDAEIARESDLAALDAGPLRIARHLEPFTAVLININKRYKVHSGVSIRGLDRGTGH